MSNEIVHVSSDKSLLIFAWEYPLVCSKQGTALARRVGQVAEDFIRNGWSVTVVHRDQINEVGSAAGYKIIEDSRHLTRIAVKGKGVSEYTSWETVSVFRQINTVLISYLKGDRSHYWAVEAIKVLKQIRPATSYHPDLIISFFTPRGPLYAGKVAASFYKTRWIADLQDSIDEGYKPYAIPIIGRWTSRMLKTASAVIHVSPEWAKRDGGLIKREIKTIRHAIPFAKNIPVDSKENDTTILYAGSIDPANQSLQLFAEVYNRLRREKQSVKLQLAGSEKLLAAFEKVIEDKASIEYKGWLNAEELERAIANADCLMVIPWSSQPRLVIPSKFYEFMAYSKPLWIVGNDTGSFEILFKELSHPELAISDSTFQYNAMMKFLSGDSSYLFNKTSCKVLPVREDELYENITQLLK